MPGRVAPTPVVEVGSRLITADHEKPLGTLSARARQSTFRGDHWPAATSAQADHYADPPARGNFGLKHLGEELPGPLVLRIGDHLPGLPGLEDEAVGHEQERVTDLPGEPDLVGHHDHRHA